MERVGVQLVAEDAAAFTRAMQGAEKDVLGFVRGAEQAGRGFRSGFAEVVVGGLREVGALGTRALVDVTRAVAGFAKDSISAAGDFEAGMNRLASVTGSALAEAGFSLDDAKNKALELGKETAFSAGQAQEAMIALAKGGVPIADIMGTATDATLGLAAAGELELASAAEIVAKQLGVWAETGVTATEVSDLLAQAANASTVDVDELALGLANAGGAAKASGVGFDDLVETMALVAPNFSSAADAGTSLKTFLLNLEPTTKPAREAMMELGILAEDGSNKFYDAQGTFLGMSNASQVLQEAMHGLNDQQRATYLETMFGSDAIRVADQLARSGAEGFAAVGQSMAGAGTAAEQAGQKQQGYNFAMETLKGSVETLQIVIGEKLLPVLTPLIEQTTGVVNAFLGWVEPITTGRQLLNELIGELYGLSPALGTAVELGQKLYDFFADGNPTIAETQFLYRGLRGVLGTELAQGIMEVLTPVQELYSAWMESGTSSQAFQDALGGIGDALGTIGQDLANWAAEVIPAAVQGAGKVVGGIVGRLIDASPEIVNAVGAWRQGFLDWATEALPGALRSLGELVGGLLDAIGAKVPEIGAVVGTWGAAFVGWATEAVPPMLGELGGLVAELGSWIAARIPDIAAQVGAWGIAFIQWAPEASAGMLVAVGGLLMDLLGWIVANAPEITATLLQWSLAFAAWVATEAIPALLVELAGLGMEVLSWIAKAAGEITGETIQLAKALYEWVSSKTAKQLLSELDGLAADVLNWIAGLGGDMASDMEGAGQDAIDGLVNAISSGVGALASAGARIARSFLDGLTGGLDSNSPSRETYREGQNAVDGLVNAVRDGSARTRESGRDAGQAVVNGVGATLTADTMQGLGTDAMLGIVDALKLIGPDIESLGAKIAGDLVDQFTEAAEAIAATIEETQAAALGGTASMSRQLQQNRKLLREIGADPYALEQMQREFAELDKNRTPENFERRFELAGLIAEQNARKELAASTQQQIAELEAERVEGAKTDKKAATELFAFRSRQVQEEAKLRLDLIQATTQAERDALLEQIDLTRQAQADELAAFRFDQEVAQSDAKNPASQLRDLQSSVTDLATKANERYTFEEKAARTGIGADGKRISREDQDKYKRGLSGTKLFRDEITAFSQRLNQATQTGQFDYGAFKAEADRFLAEYRGTPAAGQAPAERDRAPAWWPDELKVPTDVDHRQGRVMPERWKHAWTVRPGDTGPSYIGPKPPPEPGLPPPSPPRFGEQWAQNPGTGIWAKQQLPYYHQGGRGVPMGMAVLKNDEFVMQMRGGENIVPMAQMRQLIRPAASPPPIATTTTTNTTDARSYTYAPQYGGPAPAQTMDYATMRTLSL